MRRAGLKVSDLAQALGVKAERVEKWLSGEEFPSYPQALKLAEKLYLGLAHLLLPPPETQLPLLDFRRGVQRDRGREPREPSPELLEAIHDALRKQDWLKERRKNRLPFVGSGKGKRASSVGQQIAKKLGLKELQDKAREAEDFLKLVAEKLEGLGILVLRQGYVGTNTRRVYSTDEFSGFSLVDPYVPVVFLNAQDPSARQVFTLFHELAHVWFGKGGLEGNLEGEEPTEELEVWADKVAATALMPEDAFRKSWEENPSSLRAAQEAAKRFKVSRVAALRRAKELGLLAVGEYLETLEELRQKKTPLEEKTPRSKRGGNFWRSFLIRNSPVFVREVQKAALEGEIDLKEVATLLNLRLPAALTFLEKKLG